MDVSLPAESSPDDAPLVVFAPVRQSVPLIFTSPHSGNHYPAAFVAEARLDPLRLRRSEDCFVDELFAAAPTLGAPLLAARFPRAFCDANRERWELDPRMFDAPLPEWVNATSARVMAGLGTIPRVVASGEPIYRRKLSFAEAEARIARYWAPYHDRLAALIEATKRRFGRCVVIDCHSMPSGGPPALAADIVLGDGHGTSCAPSVIAAAEASARRLGYRVRRNEPYAGGFITRHYGRPEDGVHTLQIELARALYMDEALCRKLPRFAAIQRDCTALIGALVGL